VEATENPPIRLLDIHFFSFPIYVVRCLMSRLTSNTAFNQKLTEPSCRYQSLCAFQLLETTVSTYGGFRDRTPLAGARHLSFICRRSFAALSNQH
jgi:hypothetical protein